MSIEIEHGKVPLATFFPQTLQEAPTTGDGERVIEPEITPVEAAPSAESTAVLPTVAARHKRLGANGTPIFEASWHHLRLAAGVLVVAAAFGAAGGGYAMDRLNDHRGSSPRPIVTANTTPGAVAPQPQPSATAEAVDPDFALAQRNAGLYSEALTASTEVNGPSGNVPVPTAEFSVSWVDNNTGVVQECRLPIMIDQPPAADVPDTQSEGSPTGSGSINAAYTTPAAAQEPFRYFGIQIVHNDGTIEIQAVDVKALKNYHFKAISNVMAPKGGSGVGIYDAFVSGNKVAAMGTNNKLQYPGHVYTLKAAK